ncbi:Prephenate dehydrogenase, partial [Candidatus Magnetobacterium bavaricum]
GAHPIAGNDKSGLDAAVADLFRDVNCILTPTNTTNDMALKTVSVLWKTLGCSHRFQLFHKFLKDIRFQGLFSVGTCLLGRGMHLYQQAVGSGCYGCFGHWRYKVPSAHGMGWVYDNRKVGQLL